MLISARRETTILVILCMPKSYISLDSQDHDIHRGDVTLQRNVFMVENKNDSVTFNWV
jgi:hypothetical protein